MSDSIPEAIFRFGELRGETLARQVPSVEAQKAAFAEAKRRIRLAVEIEENSLSFSDLTALTEIPSSITQIQGLASLSFDDTSISDITPLAGLEKLFSLDLDDTFVLDLSPLANLEHLWSLYISNTLISDLSPVSNCKNLLTIRANGAPIDDLSPLTNLPSLRTLSVSGTKIKYLEPLSPLVSLTSLNVSNTDVSELAPLAALQRLSDLDISSTGVSDLTVLRGLHRLFNPLGKSGLTFKNCEFLSEQLQDLSKERNPRRTIEAGKIIGAGDGLAQAAREDDREEVALGQRPAPYSFTWHDERIEALPHMQAPFSEKTADEIIEILKEKLEYALSQLQGNRADPLLHSALSNSLREISGGSSAVRDGVLLMRLRTLQALSTAYFSGENESEIGVRAAVMDAALSLEDLLAVYPGARTIDANRQALEFQSSQTDMRDFSAATQEIIRVAESSDVVAPSAIKALLDGQYEIGVLSELVDTSSSEVTRAAAIERRATLASLQLLGIRNFLVTPLKRTMEELGPVAGDSWKQFKAAIPEAVGDATKSVVSGAIKAGAAGLVAMLAGPIAGMAMLAASFAPLAKAANKVAEGMEVDDDQAGADS